MPNLFGDNASSAVPIEWKGYFCIGKSEYFSFIQNETKHSFWLQKKKKLYGLKIIKFDPSIMRLSIEYLNQKYSIEIAQSDNIPIYVTTNKQNLEAYSTLSENNLQLVLNHKNLIKAHLNNKTGQYQHNREKQQEFYNLLITNPAQNQVADFMTQNSELIDFEQYMKLELPDAFSNRDRFNTPGFEQSN